MSLNSNITLNSLCRAASTWNRRAPKIETKTPRAFRGEFVGYKRRKVARIVLGGRGWLSAADSVRGWLSTADSIGGWLSATDSVRGHGPGFVGAKVTPANGPDVLCGTNIRHFPSSEIRTRLGACRTSSPRPLARTPRRRGYPSRCPECDVRHKHNSTPTS